MTQHREVLGSRPQGQRALTVILILVWFGVAGASLYWGAYQHDHIIVVGGGDSAVEAALALADQPGNHVTMSYRRDRFSRLKPRNLERIEQAVEQGKVDVLWSTNLREIRPDCVVIGNDESETRQIPNDYVFIFAGGELPTQFLKACGVEIDTKFGEP
ncbi:MAG: NAD(P)-binding domain-containing protein [Gemmatimonadota bacterium]|nr:MAG: NAD(P)-binding domain-containing protein [Gemmatimonadota bacterium]